MARPLHSTWINTTPTAQGSKPCTYQPKGSRCTDDVILAASARCTRWFKYDRDCLCVNRSQFVPVIFEPPCTCLNFSHFSPPRAATEIRMACKDLPLFSSTSSLISWKQKLGLTLFLGLRQWFRFHRLIYICPQLISSEWKRNKRTSRSRFKGDLILCLSKSNRWYQGFRCSAVPSNIMTNPLPLQVTFALKRTTYDSVF